MGGLFTRIGVLASLTATLGMAGVVEAAGLIEVRASGGEFLSEGVVEQVKAISGVAGVERYLYLTAQPHDVIGIEPGAPARIVTRDGALLTAQIEVGRGFKEGERNVALMGRVYREDYGFKGVMAGMVHPFEVGASFTFPGSTERIRVVGTFTVDPEAEAKRVFLPLATAQRLFGKAGKLTHLFIEVDRPENAEQVADALRKALGQGGEIVTR